MTERPDSRIPGRRAAGRSIARDGRLRNRDTVHVTLTTGLKKLDQESLLLGRLPELSVQLLELCRERGRISFNDAVGLTGVSRNAIKDHLSRLTKAGHFTRHGAGRGTWYALT